MKVYRLRSQLWLPRGRADVFRFFADAKNLQRITPPWLHFELLGADQVAMAAGARLDYRLRLHGFPIRWQSEITAWDPPRRFVDRQTHGPYRLWIHEHIFDELEGGTVVTDHVQFAAAGGTLLHRWLISPDVNRIFASRARSLRELYGAQQQDGRATISIEPVSA